MKTRPERFGAWAQAPDGTLVAVDRVLARRLGVEGGRWWDDAVPAPEPYRGRLAPARVASRT